MIQDCLSKWTNPRGGLISRAINQNYPVLRHNSYDLSLFIVPEILVIVSHDRGKGIY